LIFGGFVDVRGNLDRYSDEPEIVMPKVLCFFESGAKVSTASEHRHNPRASLLVESQGIPARWGRVPQTHITQGTEKDSALEFWALQIELTGFRGLKTTRLFLTDHEIGQIAHGSVGSGVLLAPKAFDADVFDPV